MEYLYSFVAEYYVLLTGLFIYVFQIIVALRCRRVGSKFLIPSASIPWYKRKMEIHSRQSSPLFSFPKFGSSWRQHMHQS